jgi:hypothetical protein
MLAAEVVTEVKRRGVSLSVSGGNLELRPASALTPELVSELRAHKAEILGTLADEAIESPSDVLEVAREALPPLANEDKVDLRELVQANKPPESGRDSMTKHDTNKAHFFRAPPGCTCDVCMPLPRYARRRDGMTFKGEN